MINYAEQYQVIKNQLLQKISPLYEIYPWDDFYNETIFGSYELDALVNDACLFGTSEEVKIIEACKKAIKTENQISTSHYTSSEIWQMKINAANDILKHMGQLVEVVLAYYKKTQK